MHKRVDAGTDVAMIGAWDAARGALPFSADQQRRFSKSLAKEASAGHVFLIHTGADGGGPVDVFVDEDAPGEEREYYHKKDYRELALIVVGWLLFLAFLPLARRWGWKIALPVTLIVALPYFHWLDRRAKRRTAANVRWREINKKLSDAWEGGR